MVESLPPRAGPRASTPYRLLVGLQAIVLVVAAFYFGRPVLMPLVLAVLLTFLLRPVVQFLERRRFPRPAAVVIVIVGVLALLAATSGLVVGQLNDMGAHLDEYRDQWRQKLSALRQSRSEALENVLGLVRDFSGRDPAAADDPAAAERRPSRDLPQRVDVPGDASTGEELSQPQFVRVMPEPALPTDALRTIWSALSEPIGVTAVVIVLTVFMLLGYEDLRGRVLRLAGQGRVTVTTKTLDDAGRRISRYLLAATVVNSSFGLAVFALLSAVGVDYPALWGFLAAVLRFIPYVGPITAAFMPLAFSIVQFPGWVQPSIVAVGFILLELVTNNVIEPLTYGRTAGVSTVALLVSATFWTWIWGPIGLALSIPLTVVLAVLGKNVPQLQPLGILLGDEPALSPPVTLYQRLLAGDVDEAADLLDEQVSARPNATVYDDLLLPVLAMAVRDEYSGQLTTAERDGVIGAAIGLVTEHAPESTDLPDAQVQLIACPAQDQADDLALTMLRNLLPDRASLRVLPEAWLAAEKVAAIDDADPDAVLISAIGPGGVAPARYLCKRLRQGRPDLRIIVCRWDYRGDRERMAASLKARGATQVVVNLAEAVDAVERIPVRPAAAAATG